MPIIGKDNAVKREGSAPGLEVTDLVGTATGSASLMIGEVTIAPNSRIPRHVHPHTEEAMVILEGTLDIVLGNQRMTLNAGHTVFAPAGSSHGFVNRYDAPARILFIFPTHDVESVQTSVPGATSGFPSEGGLTGYSSPHHRPLDKR